jgi:hypothetical protein
MFDRFFSAALAFCLLVAGTLAVATAMLEQEVDVQKVVQMPRVEVTGKRNVTVRVVQADEAASAQAQ